MFFCKIMLIYNQKITYCKWSPLADKENLVRNVCDFKIANPDFLTSTSLVYVYRDE